MDDHDVDAPGRERRSRAPTVLVVDDDPDVVDILTDALRRQGYSVLRARDGIDAMEQVARSSPDDRVDVLVTDLTMPRASGFDLIRWLTAEHRPPAIIVVSAYADHRVREEAKALGAHVIFHKPFYLDEFMSIVGRLAPVDAG